MKRVLVTKFFNRPTLRVAKDLLGKYLVRRIGSREIAGKITEVEAYIGFHDRASHASRGKTARNKVMFGKSGVWYVYFTYGMHWMLNIVTEREGYPAAILIRGVGPVRDPRLWRGGRLRRPISNGVKGVSGPARVAKFFKIDQRFNNKPAARKTGFWVEDRASPASAGRPRGVKVLPRQIRTSKRIGVDYAGQWRHKPWRFVLDE